MCQVSLEHCISNSSTQPGDVWFPSPIALHVRLTVGHNALGQCSTVHLADRPWHAAV